VYVFVTELDACEASNRVAPSFLCLTEVTHFSFMLLDTAKRKQQGSQNRSFIGLNSRPEEDVTGSSFQGLGLLAYSGSEFIFLKLMNLLDNW
jgi:hypothetical protein